MMRDEAAKLKSGDLLEYTLWLEALGNGVTQRTTVLAEYVKPSKTNPSRVVIKPIYREASWNRSRSVHINKVRKMVW